MQDPGPTRSIYMLTGGHGLADLEEAAEAFRAAIAPLRVGSQGGRIALMVENSAALYATSTYCPYAA